MLTSAFAASVAPLLSPVSVVITCTSLQFLASVTQTLARHSRSRMRMGFLQAMLLCLLGLQCATGLRSDPADAQLQAPSGGGGGPAASTARPQLRFKADCTFKIMQLTDLHYGEAQLARWLHAALPTPAPAPSNKPL